MHLYLIITSNRSQPAVLRLHRQRHEPPVRLPRLHCAHRFQVIALELRVTRFGQNLAQLLIHSHIELPVALIFILPRVASFLTQDPPRFPLKHMSSLPVCRVKPDLLNFLLSYRLAVSWAWLLKTESLVETTCVD